MTDQPMPRMRASQPVRLPARRTPLALLLGGATMIGLLLAGCGQQQEQAASDDGSVRIGVATAQTGTLAPFDVPVMRGLRLGIEQLNAAGPTQYVLVEKNVRSDAAQTAIAAQELIDDKVDLLILPCDQDLAIAAAALAADAEVPAFSTCASSPTLAPSGQGWLFGNVPADNMQATASATWAHAQGFRNAAIVQSPDTQYTTLPLYFAQVFKQLGGNVVGDIVYKTGQQNFAAEISRIKALAPAPDVIMTAAYEPDFPAFIRQLRAAGVTAQVIGSDGIDTPTILGLGAAAEGVVYTTAGFAGDDPAYASFLQQFQTRYGAASDTVFDAVGYDLSRVIAAAVEAAGPQATPKALRDAIASLSNVKGITSPITYQGTDGMPQREVALVRIGADGRSLVAHLKPDPALVPPPRF